MRLLPAPPAQPLQTVGAGQIRSTDLVLLRVQIKLFNQLLPDIDELAVAAIPGARESNRDHIADAVSAIRQHDDPIGRIDRLFDVVRRHDHCDALLLPRSSSRRVVAKVKGYPGELYRRAGSIVTNLSRSAEGIVAFNQRGTCER